MKNKDIKPGFEEQLKNLEEIVEILDSGEKPLDILLEKFEEGMRLSRSLREFLLNAEQKVIDITKENETVEKDETESDE
jgi:exodeoxyribonuclease VII small subunit